MKVFFRLTILLITLSSAHLFSSLNWTVQDMRLPTLEEWKMSYDYNLEIENALNYYHSTGVYNQTLEEYKSNPFAYINNRLTALKNLKHILKKTNKDELADLYLRACRKEKYLESLPHPLDINILKRDLFYLKKSISLKEHYWFEKLDPLHRFGNEVNFYLAEWEASNIPNYFIYLETIENNIILNTLLPFKHYVTYFDNENERQKHRAAFEKGIVYLQDKPLNSISYNNEKRFRPFIFVVGMDNELYINTLKIYKVHHSSEFAGESIQSAGEIVAKDGIISKISNSSGHYTPRPFEILPALKLLYKNYGNLSGIKLKLIFDKHPVVAYYDAQEFLDSTGQCAATKTSKPWTPLHHAIALGQSHLAPQLLQEYKVSLFDAECPNPWRLAIQNDDRQWMAILMNEGFDPLIDFKGIKPIEIIAYEGNVDLLKWIVALLPKKRLEELSDSKILLNATASGSIEMVNFLIQLGIDIELTAKKHPDLMLYAAEGGVEMLRYFEEQGYDYLVLANPETGLHPMHIAAMHGTPETLEYLKKFDMPFDQKDIQGNTLLHLAILQNNIPNVLWILQQPFGKSLLTIENTCGITPFHLSAQILPPAVFKNIASIVDNMDMIDNLGNTPYSLLAQRYGVHANAAVLLELGASPFILNNEGMAPWQYFVRNNNHFGLLQLMAHYNGDVWSFLEVVRKEAEETGQKLDMAI